MHHRIHPGCLLKSALPTSLTAHLSLPTSLTAHLSAAPPTLRWAGGDVWYPTGTGVGGALTYPPAFEKSWAAIQKSAMDGAAAINHHALSSRACGIGMPQAGRQAGSAAWT